MFNSESWLTAMTWRLLSGYVCVSVCHRAVVLTVSRSLDTRILRNSACTDYLTRDSEVPGSGPVSRNLIVRLLASRMRDSRETDTPARVNPLVFRTRLSIAHARRREPFKLDPAPRACNSLISTEVAGLSVQAEHARRTR